MKLRGLARSPAAAIFYWALLCHGLGATLAATIYWTLYDPRWVIFLGGVLFAGIVSFASQASRAKWAAVRRQRELSRVRQSLAKSQERASTAVAAAEQSELRLRRLGELLRSAVMFIDRDCICRFHNAALEEKLGRGAGEIHGHALPDILGAELCKNIQPHIEASFAGKQASYAITWDTPSSKGRYTVRQLPSQPGASSGEVCLLFTPVAAGIRTAGDARPAAGETDGVAGAHGETLYLRAIARHLTGWDDPKGKLARALAEDGFTLYEQRIKPLELGRADPEYYEVLLRMQEEEKHLLPPGAFLPEAERLGMLEELDRWVVRALIGACLERRRRQPGWQVPLYSVNLSGCALRSPGFGRFVQAQLRSRGFDGRALCFEVGELELVTERAALARLAGELRPFGCRFAIDAFGSTKGSFAPLQGLAVDFIKIDGVIVQNLLRDPAQMARARAIREVCGRIGVRTIAEFVEDGDTLAALRRIGVDYVQGFGIARPGPLHSDSAAHASKLALP